MHLDELQWFVVLAETEHVTDAAAELGISQPTLSRALNRLEEQVGVPLFDRVNRRLRLNTYGQILLEHARRGIAEIRSATERIAEMRDPDTGTVRLAFLHSQAGWFVPDLLRRFRAEAPLVRFELFQGAAHQIVERLANGEADLAVTSPRPDGFRWRGLYVERLCLAVPREHRFARRSRVRLADAGAEPFVALAPDFGLRQLTDELWAEAGISPPVVFEAMEIPTMEGLVAAGFGVAVVPVPRPERAERGAAYVPLTESSAKRQIGLTWNADRPLPPAAARLAEFVMQNQHDNS
ncbi:LysR family transcriptional regulator [Mycolicibacterium conceptionense]|uniref:LysR family transcriptional regulator n=3 Tax=Mycolicibacterium TaxID=1866885 RepID=A0ABR5FXP2_9MYCO|nr:MULTISPECIES: LysR family transcriptional regulator [Mycolicibacterium]KLI05674.1 LysR family transcriptional regulator [Mycolicibacterium senegalense]KLO52712.1 LysR family transcriptional regulator [Mycolicibacterium senegalense]MCW1823744.1 LysR family transcriptional regulator [Mycolicibacterium senegalense]OBB03696.1 LysR family transcriptional regulator [Mycolicibacterium conceptionense]OBF01420.1 LysR family transcriptional regulator [Mycolicibacterium conceptionense]